MPASLTLAAAVEKFLCWAQRHLRARTVIEYRRYLQRFARHVGDIDVSDLRAFHLVDWGTTWHRIQAVQRCFNWLVEVEYVERSPFNRVKRPRPGRRRRTFTRAEFCRLLRAAALDFRRFLIALRETIARPQEVRALRWNEIESADATLPIERALVCGKAYFRVEEYKSRERRACPDDPRIIPITRRLGRLIVRLSAKCPTKGREIFRTDRGAAWSKEATRLRLGRLRKRLGLDRDARGEHLVCYSVRHTGATTAAAAGVRDRILADIMGHTNTRTTARYQHLEVSHLTAAFDELRPKKGTQPKLR